MQNKRVVFTGPWQVELIEEEYTRQPLSSEEVLVKKIYTLISPGTELACLSGNEFWFHMPQTPGYAAVSEIVEVGNGQHSFKKGDIVFHYGDHSNYQVVTTRGIFLKVPEKLDLKWVPFTRMATIAATSIRVSDIEFGDFVSVTGLGLVGNMAAQLARLQGAHVIAIDLSPERKKNAERCGITDTHNGDKNSLKQYVMERTGGVGVSTHIEATGVPQVGVNSLELISKLGEIIFLGSPRGEYNTDVTDVLNYCHLFDRGCITFKGAHEWRYPVEANAHIKHSLVRNSQIMFELMIQNKLQVEPLISHVLAPEQAAEAYEGLRNNKEQFFGVLFDWSKEGQKND